MFGAELPQHRPHGVLNVEHSPINNVEVEGDGFCLTLLVSIRQPLEEVFHLPNIVAQEPKTISILGGSD
jgi:8-oxo-dGDP phosphatase